jgi:TolA-binding protein
LRRARLRRHTGEWTELTLKALVLTLVLLTAMSLTGCVYYNTFYHARAAAREAELLRETRAPGAPPGSREAELLDRVAEKCTRVLELHPNSSWADDALLLLGETRYYQGRYESAVEHLTEFLKRYPKGDLRPQAEYLLASALIESGNPVAAEPILKELAYAQHPGDLADDALALIGQARHKRKLYEEAVEAFSDALARFPKSDRRAEIRYLAAQNYEAMGDLDEAARQYEMVMNERGSRALAFESRMRLADVDIARDHGEDALSVLDELERRTEDRDELDRVLLLKGLALESLGRYEDAVSNYENISASHERSDASAEAHYRIGLILRDRDELLTEASEEFKKAREEAPRSDVAAKATAAARDIELLTGYLSTISASENAPTNAAVDTEVVPADTISAAGQEGATSAGADTTLVSEGATSAGADTTLVSEGATSAGADTTLVSADTSSVTPAVVREVPEAPIETAPAIADTTPKEKPEDKVAMARFRAAELYMFRFNDPQRALKYYKAVVEKHPDSGLAPKAALAIAWIYARKLAEPSMARPAYEEVIDGYPGTEFADAARESLAGLDTGLSP